MAELLAELEERDCWLARLEEEVVELRGRREDPRTAPSPEDNDRDDEHVPLPSDKKVDPAPLALALALDEGSSVDVDRGGGGGKWEGVRRLGAGLRDVDRRMKERQREVREQQLREREQAKEQATLEVACPEEDVGQPEGDEDRQAAPPPSSDGHGDIERVDPAPPAPTQDIGGSDGTGSGRKGTGGWGGVRRLGAGLVDVERRLQERHQAEEEAERRRQEEQGAAIVAGAAAVAAA